MTSGTWPLLSCSVLRWEGGRPWTAQARGLQGLQVTPAWGLQRSVAHCVASPSWRLPGPGGCCAQGSDTRHLGMGGLGWVSSLSLRPWILAVLAQVCRPLPTSPSTHTHPLFPRPAWPHLLHAPPGPSEDTCRPEHLGQPHAVSPWPCPSHHPPKPTFSLLRLRGWEGQGWRDGQKQARGIFLAWS